MKAWGEMQRIREVPQPCPHCRQVQHDRSCLAEVKRQRDAAYRERNAASEWADRTLANLQRLQEEKEALEKTVAGMEARLERVEALEKMVAEMQERLKKMTHQDDGLTDG